MRLLIFGLLCSACVLNPATGKMQLDLISEPQEIELGKQAKAETEQSLGVYAENPRLTQYVADLGKPLAAVSGRPNLPWSYEIVDDGAVNAFALPGGPVFVNRGLLAHVSSEAELVAVMGHETGHIAARHSANKISKQELAQVGLGIGSALSLGALAEGAGAGLQLLFLKYSRDDETQADELGFRFMTKVGYDPRAMLSLFRMLDGLGKVSGAGKTPQWLETHPDPGNRLEATQQRLQTELTGSTEGMKVNRDSYLKMIDGVVFGDDPRQGFFKGDTFVHPKLGFQWTVPSGWQHQNTAQAVVAASPKQDAILQLQSAGKLSPEDAAQKFFSQQGITPGQTVDVHGAKVARTFTAQTQQGAVEGISAFIPYHGDTYLLLGYTPQAGLAGYGDTLRQSMGSFGELQDSAARNVQPAKIKIVHLDAPMSVSEFHSKYPSSVKPEVVALINGAESGGQIQAGHAKQVVGGVAQ